MVCIDQLRRHRTNKIWLTRIPTRTRTSLGSDWNMDKTSVNMNNFLHGKHNSPMKQFFG